MLQPPSAWHPFSQGSYKCESDRPLCTCGHRTWHWVIFCRPAPPAQLNTQLCSVPIDRFDAETPLLSGGPRFASSPSRSWRVSSHTQRIRVNTHPTTDRMSRVCQSKVARFSVLLSAALFSLPSSPLTRSSHSSPSSHRSPLLSRISCARQPWIHSSL